MLFVTSRRPTEAPPIVTGQLRPPDLPGDHPSQPDRIVPHRGKDSQARAVEQPADDGADEIRDGATSPRARSADLVPDREDAHPQVVDREAPDAVREEGPVVVGTDALPPG